MAKWAAFPQMGEFTFDRESVKKHWDRLHRGDLEPLPSDAGALEAWVLYHNGEFQKALAAGLEAGGPGITAANKAACAYATYLQGYALGRYSQGISVAKALAQGLGSRVKEALERTIALQPRHADAHTALGAFHAEVIDKVGTLIGGMTYGAKKEVGLRMFQEAMRLHPESAIALIEYANGMVMLEGEKRLKEATRLYEQAAALQPLDAEERLDVELAREQLRD